MARSATVRTPAHIARDAIERQALYLDTETTGLDNGAEIVEICLLDHKGDVLFESLVRPRRTIPADVVSIHGITNAAVRDAPTWLEVWPCVAPLMSRRLVAVYNADFDVRMMQQSHQAYGCRWNAAGAEFLCVMRLYADFRGSYRWKSLAEAGAQCGIRLKNVHRARADALLARAVLHHIAGVEP